MSGDQSNITDKKKDKGKKKKGDEANTSKIASKTKNKTVDTLEKELANEIIADPQPKEEPEKHEDKICYYHQMQLVFYCESCEEPICQQCTLLGPHNNQLHRINNIQDSYKSRAGLLDNMIRTSLIQKRDQLLAQIYRLDYRMEEIKFIKTVIERDIRAEFANIIDRLKSSEGKKTAVIQHEMAELQKDIDKINDIVNSVKDLTSQQGDPIGFLLKARSIHDTIEFCISCPFKATIDVNPHDMPRELQEQNEKIQKVLTGAHYLDYKEQEILNLLKDKALEAEKMTVDVEKAANEEVNEWATLTDKFSMELKRFQMICFYCAAIVDENTVNSVCSQNNRTELPPGFGYTSTEPDKAHYGIKKHFFAQPKPELINYGRGYDFPEAKKYIENPSSKIQLKAFMDILLQKIRKYCNEKRISLERLFKDHDKSNSGYISKLAFRYILQEQCHIDHIEIEKLEEFFQDAIKQDQIRYSEVLKIFSRYLPHTENFYDGNNYENKFNPNPGLYDYGSFGPTSKYDSLPNKGLYGTNYDYGTNNLSKFDNLTRNPYF